MTSATFTTQFQSWQLFYSTVAVASATLAGLLFVSLTLRPAIFKGHEYAHLLRLARGSFGDFLYVLMLGLVFIVPYPNPSGLAVALIVLGLSRAVRLFNLALNLRRQSKGAGAGSVPSFDILREVALPIIVSLGLLVVAIELLRGNFNSFYWLVLVIAALLTTASWNAWLILVEGGINKDSS